MSPILMLTTPTVAPPVGPFNPGEWLISSQYAPSQAQWESDITNYLVGYPLIQGYVMQVRAISLNQGSSYDNSTSHAQSATGNYTGFAPILACYNYLQAQSPGSRFAICINWNNGGSALPSGSVSGRTVADFILNAPSGHLTLPTVFGGSTTTDYTMTAQQNGQYGWAMSEWTGSQYALITPAWWSSGVTQYQILTVQALVAFINANPGLAAGIDFIMSNDELSYAFTNGGGGYVPQGTDATLGNFQANYATYFAAVDAATPLLGHPPCISYGASFAAAADTAANMYSVYWPELAPIPIGLCGADSVATAWSKSQVGTVQSSFAQQAFIGITSPAQVATLPTPTGTSRVGSLGSFAQFQPNDYAWKGSGSTYNANYVLPSYTPGTTAFIESMCAAWCATSPTRPTHRLWWPQDAFFNTSAWGSYIYPGISAAQASYPTSVVKPTHWN